MDWVEVLEWAAKLVPLSVLHFHGPTAVYRCMYHSASHTLQVARFNSVARPAGWGWSACPTGTCVPVGHGGQPQVQLDPADPVPAAQR